MAHAIEVELPEVAPHVAPWLPCNSGGFSFLGRTLMPTSLSVTSLGMLSSVGYDVTTACAAIRAGISCARPLSYFRVLDEEAQDTVPLMGHPLEGMASGFVLLGFWVRVARACLDDLLAYGDLPEMDDTSFWGRTGLVVALPTWDAQRYQEVPRPWNDHDAMGARFLERLKRSMSWRLEPRYVAVVRKGHAGGGSGAQSCPKVDG
ncbi:hypothetical protein HV824_04615 [Myxococcus sp. AM009]|uniref:hypothetical protein n=1 Tax=Myxococcus sp. AM009 TaxID=2745137 RepID=UPI001594E79C|nr:hypothetical protein [Myxococcus sp. AM009]NVI97402.1 hypothetical protein [Myxococcus sp. AM009]